MKIKKYNYTGYVYNIEVEPNHEINDDQFFVNADNGVVVHNCHPRDNIALRWLAQKYEIGYDLFDTVMHAREIQAKNLADFLVSHAQSHGLPVVIHGKAYKPDVSYCIGSYSTLVGHYVKAAGLPVAYVDPLADDPAEVVADITGAAVILWAHSRSITYDYTGKQSETQAYCAIPAGSIVVDPWRRLESTDQYTVLHYGNTRPQ
jgi:UDPglucose 6-dehydrogenase